MYFDKNGPRRTEVFIVCGSPASGKTTYVKENIEPGDMVVDIDYIMQAISFYKKDERTDNLLGIVLKIRDFIYQEIRSNRILTKRIWVIACLPKEVDRQNLSQRLRATVIDIDTPQEECIARALKDNERFDKQHQIEMIENYFNERNNLYL